LVEGLKEIDFRLRRRGEDRGKKSRKKYLDFFGWDDKNY
jgi:hypothetical protein